ncbi:hypothetical protein [Carboxylicivirga linearis]|uniref:Lipocalin-like domain-containing protein n=1 Tax=Carboxylicivirga linearis TaxID=1628157 RepID=A0ABS5JSY7_9BACT|nr:hypothetical protein [Carboxylicivirga linearis]MBS2097910.1 hypothetical protein [Carboxylicivirga linearis]
MRGRNIIFILLLVLIWSCEKEEVNPEFGGITETDDTGIVLKSDDNDWTFYESWSNQIEDLFSGGYESDCSLDSYLYQVSAYPNPCVDNCFLKISMPMGHTFHYRIVDEDLNVLLSGETSNTSLKINVSEIGKTNEVVRMYYKILNHSCELRGHGDIMIQ